MYPIQNLIDAVKSLGLGDVSKQEDLCNLADEAQAEYTRLRELADTAEDEAINALDTEEGE